MDEVNEVRWACLKLFGSAKPGRLEMAVVGFSAAICPSRKIESANGLEIAHWLARCTRR